MMGLIVTVIIVLAILIYVLKNIFEQTDYQTWLNIALITIILLTIVLSIFMILNKANNDASKQNRTPAAQEQTLKENKPKATKNTKDNSQDIEITPQKEISEMSDEELYIVIAENYLTLKADYEKQNKGADGGTYAANKIIEEYGLTQEEWDDFYKKSVENGYFKKAEANLKKQTDYLIKA